MNDSLAALQINPTHALGLRSWEDSANDAACDFPIQNLPFAVFRRRNSTENWRGGVAIGRKIVDLAALAESQIVSGEAGVALALASQPTLNAFMAAGQRSWSSLRAALSRLLTDGAAQRHELARGLVEQSDAEYRVAAQIGDYTDFYSSIHHATNVGRLFRPDNPLLPNYKWVPIGYHGRASSIGVSGQSFHRPRGQILTAGAATPSLQPTARLDYELELGAFIGPGNPLGRPIGMNDAESHLFGLTLLNDWSARDIQAWEYQPLGPFLSKSFASTISPWVVTMEALAPFRVPFERPAADPQPLPYLDSDFNREHGGIAIQVEARIQSLAMRSQNIEPCVVSSANYQDSYWTLAQLIAHHSVNGCNLQPGDFLGTGTVSGAGPQQAGSMLELSQGGKQPFAISAAEKRTFLEDGDRVIFNAWCSRPGIPRLGFGSVSGDVLAA